MKNEAVSVVETPGITPAVPPEPDPNLSDKIFYTLIHLLSAVGAFLGAQIVGPTLLTISVLTAGVKSNNLEKFFDQSAGRFLLILSIELLTIWFIALIIRKRGWKWSAIGMGRRPTWSDLWAGLKAYGIYILIFIAVYQAEQATGLINTEQPQNLGFENPQGIGLVFVFLSLVILPPIAEEILFRGYIFMGLRKKIRFLYAALITSVLFGVVHLEFGNGTPLNWAAAIDTFTLSLVLVYVTEKSRSIWPSMIVHTLKNLLAFVSLFLLK